MKLEQILAESYVGVKMAASASRFASLGDEELDEIIDQKDITKILAYFLTSDTATGIKW